MVADRNFIIYYLEIFAPAKFFAKLSIAASKFLKIKV